MNSAHVLCHKQARERHTQIINNEQSLSERVRETCVSEEPFQHPLEITFGHFWANLSHFKRNF